MEFYIFENIFEYFMKIVFILFSKYVYGWVKNDCIILVRVG